MTTELMNGVGVFTYVGHGNFDNWGLETVFTSADASALGNGLKLPFMFNVNCLSGGFHYLVGTGSIGEDIVNNPNGGAIAAFAPSGLSNTLVGGVAAIVFSCRSSARSARRPWTRHPARPGRPGRSGPADRHAVVHLPR